MCVGHFTCTRVREQPVNPVPVYQKRFVNTAETQIINAAAVTFLKWLSFKEIAIEFEFSLIKLKRGEEEVFVSFKILTHL